MATVTVTMVIELILLALLVVVLLLIFSRVGKAMCARKLGLHCGWMAFMPFLNAYLDGRMAEASDRIIDPGRKKYRKWGGLNLFLRVISVIAALLFLVALVIFVITLILAFIGDLKHLKINSVVDLIKMLINDITNIISYIKNESFADTLKAYKFTCIISLSVMAVSAVVGIITAVIGYLIMYKTYTALAPKRAGLLLVLSFLLIPSITFIFMALALSMKADPLNSYRAGLPAEQPAEEQSEEEQPYEAPAAVSAPEPEDDPPEITAGIYE